MKPGSVIRIPDAVASKRGESVTVQPGLPGRWSVWSQAGSGPGAHFVVPADEAARSLEIKWATVRITEPSGETARVQLLETDPISAMPKTRTSR